MKQFERIIFSLIFVFIGIFRSNGQDVDGKTSFLLAGVSMAIPKNHKLSLYGAYSPTDKTSAFVIWPTFKAGKYFSFTPAYTYLSTKLDNGHHAVESQFLPSVTISIPLAKKWSLTDRNMYFYRLRKDAGDLSFYRNRLGITHRFELFKKQTSVFVHDEIFLNLDNGTVSRNRVIAGGDIKLFKFLTPQLMYMYQTDKVLGNRHLVFFIFTVPLENYSVFNTKKKV